MVSKDWNVNISCCDYFKTLPFLDRKFISRSHEKVLWSWGLLSYNWRVELDLYWGNKSEKKGKAMPHSTKEKEIFTVSLDSGSGPWNFYVWVYFMHSRGPNNFPCKRFLTSPRGMWSWLYMVPLYQCLPHSLSIPWVISPASTWCEKECTWYMKLFLAALILVCLVWSLLCLLEITSMDALLTYIV